MEAISINEINVGDIITVLYREPINGKVDRSFFGDKLKVIAIDPPYILCGWGWRKHDIPVTLDIREVTLGKPSKEFIEASTKGE